MSPLGRTMIATLALAVAAPHAAAQAAAPSTTPANRTAERAAVERAALDYLEGFYEGDTAKLVRSVRPDVDKRGYEKGQNAAAYTEDRMAWPAFLSYANQVKARNRPPNPGWPKEVVLLDVLDQTAAVKVTAWWGTDYLLMAKFDGRWMITQVLWQTPDRSE
jgi:methionine-rich copper-binding protein CopC